MKNTKLINILKTFTAEEFKLFEKYVVSPFHSRGKNCLPLLKQLRKFHPDFISEKLSYEDLYCALYPAKKFNRQVMYNLSSELEKMTRGFLVQIALRKKTFNRTELLLSEFGNRKLTENYSDAINEMEKQLAGGTIDYFYIENIAQLEGHKLDYFYLVDKVNSMIDSKRKDAEYHILLFLRMITGGLHDMTILSRNFNSKYQFNLPLELVRNLDLQKISDYASENSFKYAFLIEMYYHAITMILRPESEVHFHKLHGLYSKHYNKFTINEKRNMMYWLLSYCSEHEVTKGRRYERIAFDLNKFRLKEGLVYYPVKQIPKGNFRNIFSSALKAGETRWAENFIKEYTPKLQEELQVPVSALAYAALYFDLKKFDKVLDSVNKVVFTDPGDKLTVKMLIAKTYYEMGELESLIHHTDSFIHFINNNQSLNSARKRSYRGFLKYIKRLISISEKNDKKIISGLKEEIYSSPDIAAKIWLLQKAVELAK